MSMQQSKGTLVSFFKSNAFRCGLLWVAYTFVILLICILNIIPKRYDLRVGQVPNVTIAATKDVVDTVTTEKLRADAAAKEPPTYKYQDGITEAALAQFEQIFNQLRVVRQYGETLTKQANESYTHEELEYARNILTAVSLRDYQLVTLLSTTVSDFDDLHDSLYSALFNTLNGHVTEGQESEAIQNISMIVGFKTDTDLLQNVAIPVLQACVRPNMIIDQEATEQARKEASAAVEEVVYKQGQNIVVKGEGRITANQLAMLNTLGLLDTGSIDIAMYFGAALIVLIATALFYATLRRMNLQVLNDFRMTLLLLSILVLTYLLCVGAKMILLYAMPVALAAILCSMLFSSVRVSYFANIYINILMVGLTAGSTETNMLESVQVLLSGIISGTVAALMMHKSGNRLRLLAASVVSAVVSFFAIYALGLLTASSRVSILNTALQFMIGPALCGILALALQPMFELLFNLPTPMRLLELSNPNSPLLKKLMLEAPGTYHHSILVANLAEASAEAIGANPLLARVGAYYHDVGKLKRPTYFSENQLDGENIHDHTDPIISARILTAHPRDGAALAKQYRLPPEIQQIIADHHGNSPVMYFYHKAVQQSNGENVDINDFRYDGNRPRNKETAIIMLCDTIEAAVRSRKNGMTQQELEEYILKLVRGKLTDGQLNKSPLSLNDIDAICSTCATVLMGYGHERVAYPGDARNDQSAQTKVRKSKRAPEKAAPVPVVTVESGSKSAPDKSQEQDRPTEEPVKESPAEPARENVKSVAVSRNTGENLIVRLEPVKAPVTVDSLLQDTAAEQDEEYDTDMSPAYMNPKNGIAEEAATEMVQKGRTVIQESEQQDEA